MTNRTGYLYPQLRRTEVTAALFAGGFGFYALYQQIAFGHPILEWTGIGFEWRERLSYVLVIASLAHGIGIRVNGHGGWVSPALRFLAMAVFAMFFAKLAWVGSGGTAGYVYTWVAAVMALGSLNAAIDTKDAWKRGVFGWTWQ